ncbi:MAG: sugar ABC transporter ATP-binding protein [Agrobacterium vaccinii]
MLSLKKISKSFPGVKALEDVTLDVRAGEIHALVGENGAGKSTLTRVIAGVYQPDEGVIGFDGNDVKWAKPGDAKQAGIHVIYQEFVLFQHLSVAENIFIGYERRNRFGLIDHRKAAADAKKLLERFGLDLDPKALVKDLSIADQQMVEIAKALVHDVKLLILDEPTAVISGHEVEVLFTRLRSLRDAGVAIVYISHRLEEIFALCNRVSVLKDGHYIATRDIAEVNRDELISMMVGRSLVELFPPRRKLQADRPVVLDVRNVSVPGRVRDASITLHAGEITGLAGMVGAGRSELAFAIFGALRKSGGEVFLDGKDISKFTPARAIAAGIGLVTEDRKGQGLAIQLDIAANITASTLPTPSAYVSDWTRNTLEQGAIHLRLDDLGVDIRLNRGVTAIHASEIETNCSYTDRRNTIGCDAVVMVASRTSDDQLYHDLLARQNDWADAGVKSVKIIGDAAAPAPIAWATYAGHRYARELDMPDIGDALPFRREVTELSAM